MCFSLIFAVKAINYYCIKCLFAFVHCGNVGRVVNAEGARNIERLFFFAALRTADSC